MWLPKIYVIMLAVLFRRHQLRIAEEELRRLFAEFGSDYDRPGEEVHHLIIQDADLLRPEAHILPLIPIAEMRKLLAEMDRELDEAFERMNAASWRQLVQMLPESDIPALIHERLEQRLRAMLGMCKRINARILPLASDVDDLLLDIYRAVQQGPGPQALLAVYEFSQKRSRF